MSRLLLLLTSITLFAGFAPGATHSPRPRKVLPLDPLPNVRMKTPEGSQYLPDRVIVKLDGRAGLPKSSRSFGISALDAVARRYGAFSVEEKFPNHDGPRKPGETDISSIYVMKYSTPANPFTVARELSRQTEVLYAEPWFIYSPLTCTPNDTARHVQWNLNRILADSAYCISQGDTSIAIAIVDVGVQLDHPDLAANIWHNPGEMGLDSLGRDKRTNGVDDDHDGYIDDWQGWDFGGQDYTNPIPDNDPSPKNIPSAHGTHVAGIASAVTNDTIGIASIGGRTRLMAIKISSDNDTRSSGYPAIVFGFDGIIYAADRGARVINCSWGGKDASQFEQDVVNYATSKGALVVCAAGNSNNNTPIYPAAYDHAFAVASSNVTDHKPAYSSFGPWVDVCAPGGDPNNDIRVAVYSTDYPSTYGIGDRGSLGAGTSFAAPIAGGLAALVASQHPEYSPLQIGEQVRVTCDNIDAINPLYARQLGKGRINAVRALTESWPSIRMLSYAATDSAVGNANGSLEGNEEFTIAATFINYLQATSPSATVTLTTSDPSVQILTSSYPIGAVGTFQSVTNYQNPFLVRIGRNPSPGHLVQFTLLIDDGSYHDFQILTVLINPTFATPSINNVHVTMTNNGRIGFNDYPDNKQGSGFIFAGANQLYEGGLLLGYSETKTVDVVRDTLGTQDTDFVSSNLFTLTTPGSVSNQDGYTVFSDSSAAPENRIGVGVNLYSFSYTTSADSNYVILRYDIKNTSGADISNFYAGLFFDWDVQPDFNTNESAFDAPRSLAYAWDPAVPDPIYCGVRALDGGSGFRALLNSVTIDLSRSAKWDWLSGGVVRDNTVGDIHFVVSSGPYTISAGATQTVGFALIGGKSLASLVSSADAARSKWNSAKNAVGTPQLLLPSDGSTVTADTIQLLWSPGIAASSYLVEVSTDTGFSQIWYSETLPGTTTSIPLPTQDTTFYWHVRSANSTTWSHPFMMRTSNPFHVRIPVLQNPVLSRYADLIVSPTQPLLSTPTMSIAVGANASEAVALTAISGQLYKGSYEFHSSGTANVRVQATTSGGAHGTFQRQFAVQLVPGGTPATVMSLDRIAGLRIPAGAVNEDVFFTALADPDTMSRGLGGVYTFGPARSFPKISLSLRYPRSDINEQFLHIYRSTPSGWEPVDTWVNPRTKTLSATVTALGSFRIVYDPASRSRVVPATYMLSQNYPNPFNPQTRIRFDLPEGGRVTLQVFNVIGQEIARPVDEERAPGSFEEAWGGRNFQGDDVASGIYFYRLEVSEGGSVKFFSVQKMLLVR